MHPLCDPTGSRRFLCLQVPKGMFIDNETPIDYQQLYAQLVYELQVQQTPYWFTNDEVSRIQEFNKPYFKEMDIEGMVDSCFRMPAEEEDGSWMPSSEVFKVLQEHYPMLNGSLSTKVRIGKVLKALGCKQMHGRNGQLYQLINRQAA